MCLILLKLLGKFSKCFHQNEVCIQYLCEGKMETACLPAGEGLLPFQKAQAVVDKLSPCAICCNTGVLEKEIMSQFQK